MPRSTLQISAGVGPVEARRFVALLAEDLAVRCERAGLRVVSVSVHGDEDAPHSVEIDVAGPLSPALAAELGTHVLIARSPGRGRRSRKRWFAGVSLHRAAPVPGGPGAGRVVLDPGDLEVTAMRSGGPGGQHVNKTASAVRVLHRPTGISVRASSERSQHRNRAIAVARLEAILARRERAAERGRERALRLSHYRFERGGAVRQWRLDDRGRALRSE